MDWCFLFCWMPGLVLQNFFNGTLTHFWTMTSPLLGFWDSWIFKKWRCQPHAHPTAWRRPVSLCFAPCSAAVWHVWPYQQLESCQHSFEFIGAHKLPCEEIPPRESKCVQIAHLIMLSTCYQLVDYSFFPVTNRLFLFSHLLEYSWSI
jgi:hypothetical protein